MPCGDNGEKNWYENQEKQRRIDQTINANAVEYGKVTAFLCTLCQSIPVPELKSMIYEKTNTSLYDWYLNHLILDFKSDPCAETLSRLGKEATRLTQEIVE